MKTIAAAALVWFAVLGNTSDLAAQTPDWQAHATWCTKDGRNSGADYRAARAAGHDAYEAVLKCQAHNGGAIRAVETAGRQQVNAFLGGPPPPPTLTMFPRFDYYVIANFECVNSQTGRSAGAVTRRADSTSCQSAKNEIDEFRRGGDVCARGDSGRRQKDHGWWVHGGPCTWIK